MRLTDATVTLAAGAVRAGLLQHLDRALESLAGGGAPGRPGAHALRATGRQVVSYVHRLRSLAGRRQLPAPTRETLLAIANSLRADLRVLRTMPR
jgi:hypothetical protein